jgi:tripartite-type tricarboxylate transporter receptor subunit TctC
MRAVALSCVAMLTTAANAQQFPSKPIRLVVGFGAGGASDVLGRLYAQKLQDILQTPVIVDNKPGAFEAIAAQAITNATPDGYTIWLSTIVGLVTGPATRRTPYDPARSFTHLGKIAEVDAVIAARKDLPPNNLAELVTYAKANPGKLNYVSAGVGAPSHLIVEYLLTSAGTSATHVPYKSDADVARELAAGTVDFGLGVPVALGPFVLEGKIKGLAVTAPKRLNMLPKVSSVMEENVPEAKSLGLYSFYAFVAPAGLPPPVSQTLVKAIATVSMSPDVVQHVESMGARPALGSPTETLRLIEREVPKWRDVARKAGIAE